MTLERKQIVLNLTHNCNLNCNYCYYKDEMSRYPGYMTKETLEIIIQKVGDSSYNHFVFNLHGGEPLTLSIQYFEELLELQKKYLANKKYSNSIQTNGSLIKNGIIDLIKTSNVTKDTLSLSISLDGNIEIHDYNRIDRNGNGSYKDVIKGIKILSNNEISFSVISVLTDRTMLYLQEYYSFFKSIRGMNILNFSFNEEDGKLNLRKDNLSIMLSNLFSLWVEDSTATFDILLFSSTIKNILGQKKKKIWGPCFFADLCYDKSSIISISPQGTVSLCDSATDLIIGNILTDSIDSLFAKKGIRKFYAQEEYNKRDSCYYCKWYNICHGGCPSLSKSKNKYCKNIIQYFEKVSQFLDHNSIFIDNNNVTNIDKIKNPILRRSLYESFTNKKNKVH